MLTCCDYSLPCNASTAPIFGSADLNANATSNTVVNIVDNQTVTSTIDIGACAGSSILDVNVNLNITHTWVGDLRVQVISPSGTSVVLWPNQCTTADNLNFGADDESPLCSNLCADYNAGLVLQPIACLGPGFGSTDFLAKFDGEDPAGTWTLSVNDNATGDTGTINSWSLEISYNAPNGTAPQVFEGCCMGDLTYVDSEVQQDCASGNTRTISRKWTASDCSGNTSTCIQMIQMKRPTLADVVLPVDYDDIDGPAFSCTDNAYPTPDWIEAQGLQGYPWVFGEPDGCQINWTYTDALIPVCDGTYKIARTWTVIDWCIGTGFTYTQIIKVTDDQGPAISCPANLTV
ncbi:MAG: proprotein convertase P-domain-containing protein, partial [Saprospiraceae bacterium]|nr:proprotein convertase P-domain-containing protein [Saprospiraceae bacterium]